MKDWKILTSISDKHPEIGFPMGEVLCRSTKESQEFIDNSEFKDIIIKDYKESNERQTRKDVT